MTRDDMGISKLQQGTQRSDNKSAEKMGKSNKRNDIILRNILNIAKIKPREKSSCKPSSRKASGGKHDAGEARKSLGEAGEDKNRNLKR